MRATAALLMLHAARALRCAPRAATRRTLARRVATSDEAMEPGIESYDALKKLANEFMQRRNAGDLAGIVKDLAPKAEVYGLTGAKIQPGLEAFFAEKPGLQHEMLEEPWQLGSDSIEYRFAKSWDGGVWKSFDPEEDRDKVERLVFVSGKLVRASVEEVGRGGTSVFAEDLATELLRKLGDDPDDPVIETKPKKPKKK